MNEFKLVKQMQYNKLTITNRYNECEDDEEKEILKETMENTLYNKFAGKLDQAKENDN
jgi:hypothetical protein